MKDAECVEFLQWALPRLRRRWAGFRKVRRTTCKRIARRLQELQLPDTSSYRALLERAPDEWNVLASLLPITLSRFYRDKAAFDCLGSAVLPALAVAAMRRGGTLDAWSIGCASGEEPFTLMLLWRLRVAPSLAPLRPALRVLATDIDAAVLARARVGCYRASSLSSLPPGWRERAFTPGAGDRHCLRAAFREGVEFAQQDVCAALPSRLFDLILCRNIVFTYFDASLQSATLARVLTRLRPGGAFVIGRRETLPPGAARSLASWSAQHGIFRRTADDPARGRPDQGE